MTTLKVEDLRTIEDMSTYIKEFTAQVEHKDDEHKQAMDDEKKNHETAKVAQDEKDKKMEEAMKAMEDEKKNHEAKVATILSAVKSAMDEPDEEKKKEALKAAMKAMDDSDKPKDQHDSMHEDEEKKALKAEVTYLAKKINQPKIKYLTDVYKAAKVDQNTLDSYVADWKKMDSQQLDGAVEKVRPLLDSMGYKAEEDTDDSPLGFSTPDSFSGATKSDSFDKIDKMTTSELFGRGN